jgi:hypothetical protein
MAMTTIASSQQFSELLWFGASQPRRNGDNDPTPITTIRDARRCFILKSCFCFLLRSLGARKKAKHKNKKNARGKCVAKGTEGEQRTVTEGRCIAAVIVRSMFNFISNM